MAGLAAAVDWAMGSSFLTISVFAQPLAPNTTQPMNKNRPKACFFISASFTVNLT
jgi:hypothetical protein